MAVFAHTYAKKVPAEKFLALESGAGTKVLSLRINVHLNNSTTHNTHQQPRQNPPGAGAGARSGFLMGFDGGDFRIF